MAVNSSGKILAGTSAGGIYLSINNGSSWTQVSYPAPGYRTVQVVGFNSSGDFLAGIHDGGLYLSTNNGSNWNRVDSGWVEGNSYSLVINSSGNIFAGVEGGVFLSTNSGWNWTRTALTGVLVLSVAINAPGNIFAGEYRVGVYLSTDDGNSWTQTSLDSMLVYALAINSSGEVFAGTTAGWNVANGGGVYHSTNNGGSWTEENNGLTNTAVYSLVIDASGYIFAGTGGGVFRSINSTTDVKTQLTIPKEFALLQNYPNPFNPSTLISYQLPTNGFVTLEVYDVLGSEVRTLVNDRQTAGTHSVKFNAGNLSSGVYFYRIAAGNFIQTKKLMLLK